MCLIYYNTVYTITQKDLFAVFFKVFYVSNTILLLSGFYIIAVFNDLEKLFILWLNNNEIKRKLYFWLTNVSWGIKGQQKIQCGCIQKQQVSFRVFLILGDR